MNAGIKIDIRLKRLDEIKFTLSEMERRMVDLSPVWEKFIPFYIENVIKKNWDLRGALLGRSWKGLSANYRKRKQKLLGRGQVAADLQLTGRLKRAATGGDGWYQKIEGNKLTIGIHGIPYANIHQRGGTITGRGGRTINMPQRPYFVSADDGLPGIAEQKLIDLLREHSEGVIV